MATPAATAAAVRRFNSEVAEFSKRFIAKELPKFQKKIAFEVLIRIVRKTPVDTGRARGNWLIGIGQVPQAVTERLVTSDEVSGVIIEELAKLGPLQPFQVVFITNNLDYIEFLEEGSSKQAPAGMIAISLAEILEIFP